MNRKQCDARVSGFGIHLQQCSRTGSVCEDGKRWCKQHAPSLVRARQEASLARHEKEWAQSRAKNRLSRAAPELLAALIGLQRQADSMNGGRHAGINLLPAAWAELSRLCYIATAAIAKAEGKE